MLTHMRTTLQLPDEVVAAAKKAALSANTTLTAFVTELSTQALARRRVSGKAGVPVRLTTYGRKGLQDGVDLDDTAALLDRMDGADSP